MKRIVLLLIIVLLVILAVVLGYLIVARRQGKVALSGSLMQTLSLPQPSPSGPTNLSPNICKAHGYPKKDDFLAKYNLSASVGNYFVVQGVVTEVDSDHWVVQGNSPKTSKGTDVWLQSNTKYIGKQNYKVGDCVTVVANTVGDASKIGSQQAVVVESQ